MVNNMVKLSMQRCYFQNMMYCKECSELFDILSQPEASMCLTGILSGRPTESRPKWSNGRKIIPIFKICFA